MGSKGKVSVGVGLMVALMATGCGSGSKSPESAPPPTPTPTASSSTFTPTPSKTSSRSFSQSSSPTPSSSTTDIYTSPSPTEQTAGCSIENSSEPPSFTISDGSLQVKEGMATLHIVLSEPFEKDMFKNEASRLGAKRYGVRVTSEDGRSIMFDMEAMKGYEVSSDGQSLSDAKVSFRGESGMTLSFQAKLIGISDSFWDAQLFFFDGNKVWSSDCQYSQ